MKRPLNKFLLIVLATAIALCALIAISCYKEPETPSGQTYYLYDEDKDAFDEKEYILINGEKCAIGVKGEDGMKDLVIDGTVTYEDNKVHGNCGVIVTELSDFLSSEGLEDMYEELGVTKLDIEFSANIKCEFDGILKNNMLIVTKQSMTVRGFTGLLAPLNSTQSSTDREIYCIKDQTPDYSSDVTIDCNGGTVDGKSTVIMRTDKAGELDLSAVKPERDGYIFSGFTHEKDFGGSIFHDSYKTHEDKTIYVFWKESITVRFDINSTEYKVKGDTVVTTSKDRFVRCPEIEPTVSNPITRFKGWYSGSSWYFGYGNTMGHTFIESKTLTAQWYSANEVNEYNAELTNYAYSANFVIHFTPKGFSVEDADGVSNSSYYFCAYSVQNGQKGNLYGRCSLCYNYLSDKAGEVHIINGVPQAYDGDVYLEIKNYYTSDEVQGSFIIKKSDLGIAGKPKCTHIFIDEHDLNSYRTQW